MSSHWESAHWANSYTHVLVSVFALLCTQYEMYQYIDLSLTQFSFPRLVRYFFVLYVAGIKDSTPRIYDLAALLRQLNAVPKGQTTDPHLQ